MKKILLIITISILTSCKSDKHIERMHDLEYLEKLYQVRGDIQYKTKMKTLDSLIKESRAALDTIKNYK